MPKAKKLNSGTWRVQVRYKDEFGNFKNKSITAKTKKEAEYKALEFKSDIESGKTYSDLTLGQAYDRYIKSKSNILSPSTLKEYKRQRNAIFKELMFVKLEMLTPELIQTAINEYSVAHSAKSVRNAHGLLYSVIKTYLPNFEFKTTLPKREKPDYIIPTTEDINKLLEIANNKIRIPILLASQAGLRRGEVCALTLNDISDFGVTVNKAVVYDDKGNLITKTPKTVAGTRFVPLSQELIQEVKQWEYFGISPKTIDGNYRRLFEKLDINYFSFHKLRHYFASELHARGIPDKYIAEIGGWETISVLQQIYQHTLKDEKENFSNQITSIFSGNFKNCSTNCSIKNKKSQHLSRLSWS